MREQNLKTVRDACIAANPSIADLVFGCRVRYILRSYRYAVITGHTNERNDSISVMDEDSGMPNAISKSWITEIIGRPIRLADVLLAIKEKSREDAWQYAINPHGQFMRDWGENRHETVNAWWNLADDDLDKVSDECAEFLAGLLGKGETL